MLHKGRQTLKTMFCMISVLEESAKLMWSAEFLTVIASAVWRLTRKVIKKFGEDKNFLYFDVVINSCIIYYIL